MSQQAAIDTLVEALAVVPEYDNPLTPIYEALGQEQPLTLRAIRQHSRLLHDQTDLVQEQTYAVNSVIQSCLRIPPTPLPLLPLGF
jgi:hypothetical protein